MINLSLILSWILVLLVLPTHIYAQKQELRDQRIVYEDEITHGLLKDLKRKIHTQPQGLKIDHIEIIRLKLNTLFTFDFNTKNAIQLHRRKLFKKHLPFMRCYYWQLHKHQSYSNLYENKACNCNQYAAKIKRKKTNYLQTI